LFELDTEIAFEFGEHGHDSLHFFTYRDIDFVIFFDLGFEDLLEVFDLLLNLIKLIELFLNGKYFLFYDKTTVSLNGLELGLEGVGGGLDEMFEGLFESGERLRLMGGGGLKLVLEGMEGFGEGGMLGGGVLVVGLKVGRKVVDSL
jgi:hypothetical protein